MKGIVKFFKNDKKFGFICPDGDNAKDIFVHQSDVEDNTPLLDGQHVEYDIEDGPMGPKAKNVRIVPEHGN